MSAGTIAEEPPSTTWPRPGHLRDVQPGPGDPSRGGARYAAIVATGRSDFPNQINNVLAFPGGVRRSARRRRQADHRGMKIAAADAILSVVADDLRRDQIVPSALDRRVAPAVAAAVAEAARAEGVA